MKTERMHIMCISLEYNHFNKNAHKNNVITTQPQIINRPIYEVTGCLSTATRQ